MFERVNFRNSYTNPLTALFLSMLLLSVKLQFMNSSSKHSKELIQ